MPSSPPFPSLQIPSPHFLPTPAISSLRNRIRKLHDESVCMLQQPMDYEERLKAAAHLILSNDRHRLEQDPPLDCSGLGVSAVLKPHQIDGVSWLIRRYVLGVNVVLGTVSKYRYVLLFYVLRICSRTFIRVLVWLQETRSGSSTQLSRVRCVSVVGILHYITNDQSAKS